MTLVWLLLACATTPDVPSPRILAPLVAPPAAPQTAWQQRQLSSGLVVRLQQDDTVPLVEMGMAHLAGAPVEALLAEADKAGWTRGEHTDSSWSFAVSPAEVTAALSWLGQTLMARTESSLHPRRAVLVMRGDLDVLRTWLSLEATLGPWLPIGPVPAATGGAHPAPSPLPLSGQDLVHNELLRLLQRDSSGS